jgi:hypothetical protein
VNVAIDAPIVDTRPPVFDVAVTESQPADTPPAIDTAPVEGCIDLNSYRGIATDVTLTKACSPYSIYLTQMVRGNATLTIEPGVTLRFGSNTYLAFIDTTKLVAEGTAADPIIFTSSNPTPGPGDWQGVLLGIATGATLRYLMFDYCGSPAYPCLLGADVKPNQVLVDHVTFSHVGPGANAISEGDSNFVISNCTFNDIPKTPTQQYAISVSAQSFAGIDSNNTFNGGAMVEVGSGTISTDTSWKNIGTTVAVDHGFSIGGPAAPTLTMAAGSIFKFTDSGIDIGHGYNSDPGKLVIAGTASSRVTLTSLEGGPAPGDWTGITLGSSGQATIQYADISYGGGVDPDNLAGDVSVDNGATLTISNSALSNSSGYGLWIDCGSSATVTDTAITYKSNVVGDKGPGPTGATCP